LLALDFLKKGGDIMKLVSINTISKIKERQKYLPLEIRIKMYDDVIELRKQGLKHKEIQRRIYEKYKKRLPIPTIFCWANKKHHPFGKVNKFDGKPSLELEYVIGTILSDGFKHFDGKRYHLRLAVIDKEFAEAFGKNLAEVLGRKKSYKLYWNKYLKRWVVVGFSVQLFKFLDRPLEELKPHIEYSKETVASFLRALFDAEGSVYVKIRGRRRKRMLTLYNTNKELLIYAKYLLKKYFDINTTGPYLKMKRGEIAHFPNGKKYKANEDCYYIYVRVESLQKFYENIGFMIKRKQLRLIKAIK
jgi:hypothetical protein